MSGPIVRKYGFPNFEKIFGAQEPKHGVDDQNKEGDGDQPAKETESSVAAVPEKPKKS